MGDLWMQVMTRSEPDRQRLERAARVKMQTEDAIGGEQVLAREPNHADLHNDVALIYMSLGRRRDALRHFAAVTVLRPESAPAYYNEGVALEAAGDIDRRVRGTAMPSSGCPITQPRTTISARCCCGRGNWPRPAATSSAP